jgi:predicted hotdog family 3-hydroxylacyl-ACP dehydratase
MRVDRSWIEAHIPHDGRMCLLDEVVEWNAQHIRCRSGTHRLPGHPLRSQGRLGIACGIEYAAQAMAAGGAPPARAQAGFLASLREIRLGVLRLDDVETDLHCEATCLAANPVTALYEFALWSDLRRLLSGRATVVLDAGQRGNI